MLSRRFISAGIVEKLLKGLTLPANGDFLFPGVLFLAIADRAGYKPAHFTGIEFIGRTLFAPRVRAFFDVPAFLSRTGFLCREIEYLALGMAGNGSPSLLVAMDRLQRCAQQLSDLLLGFF
jgi:hypothetical protein